ncbi:MAG: sigma 54-interacting transcriptional regulator, partial [Planctomycetota bacterium]
CVNCAALPRDLLEAELFGIEQGVATGVASRAGIFEQAHGGTVFLDEIGDMPLETQVKLLRAIQERKIWPVGSEDPIDVDFRLVAATHRNLDAMRRKGEFRDDLFYRIAVLTVELPPLRDRGEDIVRIAERCLPEEFDIDAAASRALLAYQWPGNIRELQNAMEHASFNAPAEVVRLHDLPKEIASVGRRDRVSTRVASLKEMEMRHIRRALEAFNGNKKRSAEALGISRETLYQKIKTYGL